MKIVNKYIDIWITKNYVTIQYANTYNNVADILTKPLGIVQLGIFHSATKIW